VVRRDYESGAIHELFAEAHVVVHAAGATRAPSHAKLHASNVALTRQTLDAVARANVPRFVFISSQAAAGPSASRDAPVTERDTAMPIEAYGRSKLEAERLVRASKVPWVVLRPAAVYGPYDRDFLALHRLASRGVAIHPGNREQWISLIHVEDLAGGVVCAAIDASAAGETFFLANQTPVQWGGLFRTVAECAGRKVTLDLQVPRSLVGIGALIGDVAARITGHAGLLTSDKVALAKASFWVCSSARARDMLQFSTAIELQRGLCDTYHWYRTQGWI
jgi:nucleoside-diphosphate-sugar epimerase